MKTQLWSDHVNMQPDKTKCHPQKPITIYGLQDADCWVHLVEAPPAEQWDIIITLGYRITVSTRLFKRR